MSAAASVKTPLQKGLRAVTAIAVVAMFVGLWQDFTYETRPEWVKTLPAIMCLLVGAQLLIDPALHLTARAARWLGITLVLLGALDAVYLIIQFVPE
jgi:predicted ferric reductase